MTLHIHNSLTGKKELFVPITPGKVGMYVCGMTVYDYCHLGHARVMVVFDVVVRYLRTLGYKVTYVRNITDIDDKIIKRAAENNESIDALTQRFIDAMHEDERALGVLPPDIEPRATDSIDGIIKLVQTLIEKGYAYQAPGRMPKCGERRDAQEPPPGRMPQCGEGMDTELADNADVYYDVSHFERYGELSGRRLEDLRAGSRVDIDEAKDDPLDFVLWKSAKPGEPSWPSPWGQGRPGWHIECSAMSCHTLGEHFDIHGGGMDLKFPHHENEIAQSEAATGHKFVNVWMHNGFVQVDNEKMSKSRNNFFTVRDVLNHYKPEVIRYFILSSHYRGPLHYSTEHLNNAKAALERFYMALRGFSTAAISEAPDAGYKQRFNAAMNDDFNTAEALAVLFDLVREINRLRTEDTAQTQHLVSTLRMLGSVLGLLQTDPESFFKGESEVEIMAGGSNVIEHLILQRNAARANKNWKESDRIRDVLKDQGILLEDGAAGTTWRRE